MIIDPSLSREMIQRLMAKLKDVYIFPDVADQICANMQKHLEDGDYQAITDGEFLAFALTTHLQEVNHDQHLWVRYHAEPLPDEDSALRDNRDWQEQRLAEARLENFGFYKVERLPGNVGYLDIRYFHRPAWGGDTAVSAMNFLAHTSVLIIDLRRCTGGYPGMIALILSYLFGEEPVHLSSIYWRDEHITQQYWTLPYIPGRRYGSNPVYVLTSGMTFSGGEEFASILQTRKRAVVMGDPTDGGAHPGASYRLDPHFEVFIPIGLATNPVTGKDLEGIGVAPDISIPQEHALLAAYYLSLKTVGESLRGSPSELNEGFTKEVQTALNDLVRDKKFCPKCGYQNPLYKTQCKNCSEPLPGEKGEN